MEGGREIVWEGDREGGRGDMEVYVVYVVYVYVCMYGSFGEF